MTITSLPDSVRLEAGPGGLPVLRVTAAGGSATVHLHGAQVTDWHPTGHGPRLWLSSASRYTADAAIRGGVPICFPWFGAHPTNPTAPAHGFARVTAWDLVSAQDDGSEVTLVLRLTERSLPSLPMAWPHRFVATYTVAVGARLGLSLEVVNQDDISITFEEALHTYLRVGDVRRAEVTGLERTAYLDKVAGSVRVPGEPGPVRLTRQTDRIYLDTTAATTVRESSSDAPVTVTKAGSRSTVVWNPWAELADRMSDVGPGEWTTMLCVETANVGPAAVRLEPGQRHVMSAVLEVG